MIPVLFDATVTTFISSNAWVNISGFLSDCAECTMHEERNGVYELTMRYPTNGVFADQIVNNALIGVEVPVKTGRQPKQVFRVYDITSTYDGMMTVYAQHISYIYAQTPWYNHAGGGYMWDNTFQTSVTTISGATTILNTNLSLFNQTITSVPISSNITTTLSSARKYPPVDLRSIRNCIGGQEGSLLDLFGGELEWDNLDHVYLNSARGEARDYYVEYGVNIIDATMEQNIAECYTGVVATWRWTNPDTGNAWECYAVKEAANASSFAVKRWYIYDCTGNDNLQNMKPDTQANMDAIFAKVQGLANTKATEIQVGVPRVSIDVDFADLLGTEEYKQFRSLEQFYLCDTVNVVIPKYNVNTSAKITSVEYDVLNERYLTMHIGDAQVSTLADTIVSMSGNGQAAGYAGVINEPYVAGTNIDITDYVISAPDVALASQVTPRAVTLTAGSHVTIVSQSCYMIGRMLYVAANIRLTAQVAAYGTLLNTGHSATIPWHAPLYTNGHYPIGDNSTGLYGDVGNQIIRTAHALAAGTYWVYVAILVNS